MPTAPDVRCFQCCGERHRDGEPFVAADSLCTLCAACGCIRHKPGVSATAVLRHGSGGAPGGFWHTRCVGTERALRGSPARRMPPLPLERAHIAVEVRRRHVLCLVPWE